MGAVTLKVLSYPELPLVSLNLLSERLTQYGLGHDYPGKNLPKVIAGRD